MRGFKEVSWKTAKGMMSDTNFLNTLKNMDVDGISINQVHVHLYTKLKFVRLAVPSQLSYLSTYM